MFGLSSLLKFIGGAFLGWSLGANDSANVFGTAVSSRMVSYRLAVILTAVFVIIGALAQGRAGIETYSHDLKAKQVASIDPAPKVQETQIKRAMQMAMIASFSAALTVTIMTILKIPVSTSQAVVGAIIGVGLMQDNVNYAGLGKVIVCWIGTPIGAAILTIVFYYIFSYIFRKLNLSVFIYDPVITILLIICGSYGAYALGANNVANVSGVFVGKGMLTVWQAALFGGIAIAVGVITFSKPVMMTVGKGIVKLNAFTAFLCVLSQAVTVHIYAIIGVPVSTSQAIVGAVLGLGVIKGAQVINYRTLLHIGLGWMATPFVALVFAIIGYFMSNLTYSG